MDVKYVRILLVICIFEHCLAFTNEKQENVDKYNGLVNSNPGTAELNCRCPTSWPPSGICDCSYYNQSYIVESPFAAHLLDLPPLTPWQPKNLYPLPHYFPIGFRVLTGFEQPLPEVKLMPSSYDVVRARFKLFFKETNVISSARYLMHGDLSEWKHPKLHPPSVLYVVIHGWTGSDFDIPIRSLRAYLLMRKEYPNSALITVNWNEAASGTYRQAVADSLVIGYEVGLMFYNLVESGRIPADKIHVIGADMGSHIAKIAANVYSTLANRNFVKQTSTKSRLTIGRRTGLNPFATNFQGVDNKNPQYDADYVDIIHTSTARNGGDVSDILNRNYGISTLGASNPAQVDFYPNNGAWRGVCDISDYGCGLRLALAYFKASLRNDYKRHEFVSYSSPDILRRANRGAHIRTGVMGIDAPSVDGKGNQFLRFRIPRETYYSYDTGPVVGQPCTAGPKPVERHPLSYPTCGESNVPQQRMFNGVTALPEQFPWTVCIFTNYLGYVGQNIDAFGQPIVGASDWWPQDEVDTLDEGDTNRHQQEYEATCSGVLIEPFWVLTAAHCFKTVKSLVPVYLVFGALDCQILPSGHFHRRRVIVEKRNRLDQTVFIHESYPFAETSFVDTKGDIALVRLRTAVVPDLDMNINPICYRESATYPYGDCARIQAAGYGAKSHHQDDTRLTWMRANVIQPDNLRHSFVARPKYGLHINELLTKNPSTVFAFASFEEYNPLHPEGRAVCFGDSGGQITDYHLLRKDNRATLVGLIEGGSNCSEANTRKRRSHVDGTYVETGERVDCWNIGLSVGTKVAPYIDWITSKLTRSENPYPKDNFKTPAAGSLLYGPDFGAYLLPDVENRPYQRDSWYDFGP